MEATADKQEPRPNLDSLQETMKFGYNMISLIKPEGPSEPPNSILDFIEQLDVPRDHPKYEDVRIAFLQVSEFCRTLGIMGSAGWPDAKKDFVSSGSGLNQDSENFRVYVKRLNDWSEGKKINVGFGDFASALATQLKAKGVDDIAGKALTLAGQGPQASNNGTIPSSS